jgi:tetratricopeptide (TPR) repeat protein/SAM-dependent methyltransferase
MSRNRRQVPGPPGLGSLGLGSPSGSAAGKPSAGSLAELFGAAVSHHQSGALAEAERRYRYIVTLFPDHADSLHNLGLLALHRGDANAAAELIARAIKINNRIAEYHYNIALAWRALNRTDEVAASLERAIVLRRDHALAHLNLGNIRREQGRLADAVASYERAIASGPNSAAAHFNLANIFSEQGRWDAAIAGYRQVLALDPNHAETHNFLGVALMAQGKISDAIRHFEAALAAQPDLPGVAANLSKAYVSAGRLDLAAHAGARALELEDTPQSRTFFAQCVRFVRFTADTGGLFRKLVLRALAEGWARPRELVPVCISLIKLNGVVNDCIARAHAAWPTRLPATELFGPSGVMALADDELLCCLLECDPIADVSIEHLLTSVRHAMLTSATGDDQAIDARQLKFYAAVARQCFINEYVFSVTDAEAEQAQRLRASLEETLATGAQCSAFWPIVVGAYFPLHTLSGANVLLDRSWPEFVDDLLTLQIREPAQERRIAATIPSLTGIDDAVSRAVRQQYEENPYPRWIKAGPPAQSAIPDGLGDRPTTEAPEVLIAGCGTGLSATEFARQMSRARVLAIDLSLASLSYAKRMGEKLGLTNIEFAQADIMALGSIKREFDFIDASGVLHHMGDPWAGWRELLSLLRPGGVMQVGLYSKLGRQNIVAARALIAERGYRPILDGIRRCRDEIVAAEDGSLLKSIVQLQDFFATSECRDLLFHVQEHRITLPEIKSFLAANEVQFAGFLLEPNIRPKFVARFPAPADLTDLDRWHDFETETPGVFAGMYQFWVCKPVRRSHGAPAELD